MVADEIIEEMRQMAKGEKYEIQMGMAHIYYQNYQYVKAEEIFLNLLKLEEKNEEIILEGLAWIYFQL